MNATYFRQYQLQYISMQTLQPYYDRSQTETVGFDLSTFGKVSLTGKDRGTFLQSFTTNDVVKPGMGFGCETFVTTAQARLVAWLRLALREQDLYANMEPGLTAKVISHLDKYVIGEQVQFEDRTESDFLWLLTGAGLQKHFPDAGKWHLWQHQVDHWSSITVTVQRSDFLGMPGVFVWGQRKDSAHAEKRLQDWDIPLLDVGHSLWTTLRLEAGTPAYGIDLDETMLPQEANRTEAAISFTKGCYLGQETVARIRAYGHVNKQLVRLQLHGDAEDLASWQGAVLKGQDKEAGKLKSVGFSPRLQSAAAFGVVRKEYWSPDTMLEAHLASGAIRQARVITAS